MKIFTAFLMLALLVGVSSGAILKVASDGTQPYSQIQDAVTASSAGDTVLIMAGGYTGFTVDKKLVIIGAGTGEGIGEGVLVAGIVTVLDAADSTELRSFSIRGATAHASSDSLASILRIRSGANRIFVWRCFIENNSASNHKAFIWASNNTSVDIVQSTLWNSSGTVSDYSYGLMQRTPSTVTLTSCAFVNLHYGCYRYGTNTGASLMARHCLFTCTGTTTQTPFYTEAAGVAENCAFITNSTTQTYSAPNMSYNYCAYTVSSPPGATHTVTTTAAFVNMLYANARTSDFHLAAGSNLIDAGNPGSPDDLDGSRADISIYGGQHPYVDGGVPDYPFAVQIEVPYSAPLNGTMRIWGRGRVGPGY
jgi:hypothetical protein